jgi:hypothetical protein
VPLSCPGLAPSNSLPSLSQAELGVVGAVAADSQVLHFVGSANGKRCSLLLVPRTALFCPQSWETPPWPCLTGLC